MYMKGGRLKKGENFLNNRPKVDISNEREQQLKFESFKAVKNHKTIGN